MASAFAVDDRFAKFFPRIDESHRARLLSFFSFACDIHAAFGMPFIGAVRGQPLVAVATVQEPVARRRSGSLGFWSLCRAFVTWRIGFGATRLMREYTRAVEKLRPEPPFHYVSYVGVLSEARGEGLVHRLLDAAHSLAHETPASRGLVLDTFNPDFARSLGSRGWSSHGPVSCGPIEGYSLLLAR